MIINNPLTCHRTTALDPNPRRTPGLEQPARIKRLPLPLPPLPPTLPPTDQPLSMLRQTPVPHPTPKLLHKHLLPPNLTPPDDNTTILSRCLASVAGVSADKST